MARSRRSSIDPAHLEPYGHYKAKISLKAFTGKPRRGKLVLVSAITPTPAGEGKTTTTVGLVQGLAKIGVNAAAAARAVARAGVRHEGRRRRRRRSEIVPMMDINMHFNGDFHAVSAGAQPARRRWWTTTCTTATRSARPRRVTWKRVVDMNDRALRDIIIGLGGHHGRHPARERFRHHRRLRSDGRALPRRRHPDPRRPVSAASSGYRTDGTPVTAKDPGAVGAMAALLKEAVKPNLVQTTEGVPAFVHGGPFANIAHGTNTINATKAALAYADIVVTEAGFAFELGAEKFFDINCRYGGFAPACTVLVADPRARSRCTGGKPLAEVSAARRRGDGEGFEHGEAPREHQMRVRAEVRRRDQPLPTDSKEEIETLKLHCEALGLKAVVAKTFSEGGKGCTERPRSCATSSRRRSPRSRRCTTGTIRSRTRSRPSRARCTAPSP